MICFQKCVSLENSTKSGEIIKLFNKDDSGPFESPSGRALSLSSGSESDVEVIEVSSSSKGSEERQEREAFSPEYSKHVKISVRKDKVLSIQGCVYIYILYI